MTQEPADADLVGTTLAGKYRVLSLIGSGGMGAVYEVEHTVTRRIGAFKLLHPVYAAREDIVARFIREASAAARIGDPHIVESFDAGTLPSGAPYIFMERLRGSSLGALIEKKRQLPPALACDLVAQAAAGLESAHRQGIVHRDVKPENLFVCEGPTPFVKILDFGICRLLDEESSVSRITQEGTPLGTPHYMSREQVVSSEVTFRTDIHALGVVFYECLTGEVPFDANTLPALALKIFEGDYPPATRLAPGLPTAVDALLATALAPDPAQGFASMAEFRAAVLALAAPASSVFGDTQVASSDDVRVGPAGLRTEPSQHPQQETRGASARVSPPRSKVLLAIAGIAVAGVAAAGAVFSSSPDEPMPDEPSPSASTHAVNARPEASISPAPSAPASSNALPPASAVSAASAVSLPVASDAQLRPPPSGHPRSLPPVGSSSRAERDGLARENPFE